MNKPMTGKELLKELRRPIPVFGYVQIDDDSGFYVKLVKADFIAEIREGIEKKSGRGSPRVYLETGELENPRDLYKLTGDRSRTCYINSYNQK